MKTTEQALRCELCPKSCLIRLGQSGQCRIRMNVNGEIKAVTYGQPCSVHVDPVEKKPFFHFLPGTSIFSLATVGCNLHCQNCQNWEISQGEPGESPAYELPPEQVPVEAKRQHCPSVAYTYTEPLVFYEYTRDCARACKAAGLRNAIVTAGYINPGPMKEICGVLDAAHLDIKAMSDKFYREVCDASLAPVLKSVEIIKAAGLHLELSNLVVPTLNDSDEMLRDLVRWIVAHVGVETPLHFLRFFPQYRMTHLPPTPPETLLRARDLARAEGLKHVYVGNLDVPEGEDTFCAGCGKKLIQRQQHGVVVNFLRNGACPDCKRALAGVWQ